VSYVEALTRELARVGIGGSTRHRIAAEIEDHLASDPAAELGDPAALARQFADELGTTRARRAGFTAFGALAIAGVLFALAFLVGVQGFARRGSSLPALAVAGGVLAALGAQVAFVAGGLTGLRSLRLRGSLIIPRAEAVILARRTAVGLAAGLAAMGGMALLAAEYNSSGNTFALIASGVGALALLGAGPLVVSATRVRPIAEGQAGDIFDDLGPLIPPPLRDRPWRFALLVAVALAVAITVAGVAQHDPYDGALRGLADGLACLGGYAVFGRYLGLRATSRSS
jgi:hypothetical protein